MRSVEITGWRMHAGGELQRFSRRASPPGPGRVLVEVAGCGLCHTDLSYLYGGVPTKKAPPLVLGHEISGVVVAAGEGASQWLGRRVLVPAVSPCGECQACRSGRATACRASLMPGNDHDGGFATHVEVPARPLCPIDPEPGVPKKQPIGAAQLALWEVAVVADAVTTPLQAIRRCGLRAGDLAVVVGVGGVGIFVVQLAAALGAEVVAVDLDRQRLALASELGARLAVPSSRDPKAVRAAVREHASRRSLAQDGWRVFEVSGTPGGQQIAWSLLTPGGSLSVVGFSAEPTSLRLSNLMAFDASAYGNWGCGPELYPEALARVASGEVKVRPLVRGAPLDEAPRVLDAVHHREIHERVVFVP